VAVTHDTRYFSVADRVVELKDGKVAFMLERRDIEGRPAERIAEALTAAFDQHC
jgi:putative YphP/YqiW family bacilliredoxin